jgi:hypothetical protein
MGRAYRTPRYERHPFRPWKREREIGYNVEDVAKGWFGGVLFACAAVACGDSEDATTNDGTPPGSVGNVGAPCLADDEFLAEFSGYAVTEVSIETLATECDTGMCVTNHFRGRASCPYGQTAEQAATAPACFIPDSDEPVTVPVEPWFLTRRAETAMTCSCQCGGPGDGPFCTCPSGTTCAQLSTLTTAQYCAPPGGVWDPTDPTNSCSASAMDCGDPRPY